MKSALPIYVVVKEQKCLVVGGGSVALRKVNTLLEYTDQITVISPEISKEIEEHKKNGNIELIRRDYKKGDLQGYFLVIAATDSSETNRKIAQEAKKLGLLYNVVDEPDLCNFYAPSIIKKGDLQVAISTSGTSPAFAKLMRKYLEEKLRHIDLGVMKKVQAFREELKKRYPRDVGKRMKLMNEVVNKINLDDPDIESLDASIMKVLK